MFYPVFGVVTRVHRNMQNKELRNLFFSPYIAKKVKSMRVR